MGDGAVGRRRRADGRPVVVASTRVLLSYARSDSSILCGWVNGSLPDLYGCELELQGASELARELGDHSDELS